MEKCVLLRGTYVMVIIQPWQVDMCFSDRRKKQTGSRCSLFFGEYFHERRVIAEGEFLLNTFMVQI